MPEGRARKGGKKNRKHGSGKRSPAHMRYIAACGGRGRCFVRKIKNLVKHCKWSQEKAEKYMHEVYRARVVSATATNV